MKTILLFISLLIGVFSAQAETIEVSKVSDEAIEVVDHLCNKLQVPAEHVWEVMVKAQAINFYEHLIVFLIFLILSIVSIRITAKYWDNVNLGVIGTMISGATMFCTIISIVQTLCNIKCVMYPEYSAILEILEILKK